ncbi:hypothetical protein F4818DRAFT_398475 [Hypoxylon cercidicola]|nr:hypothetical protein F4818DRAFT_398475 [Hypoxylon cercidicola]
MAFKRQSTTKSRDAEPDIAPRRTSKRRKTRYFKIKSPEVGSLYDILHDSSGSALYVPPFCWTDQHTHLLGRFVQRPPQNTPTPSASSSPRRTPQPQTPHRIIEIGGYLDSMMVEGCSQTRLNTSIQTIMEMLFPNRLSRTTGELTMRCGSKHYNGAIRCWSMWKCASALRSFDSATASLFSSPNSSVGSLALGKRSHTAASYDTPILAYVSRSHLNFLRRNCFRIQPFPDGSFNSLIHRLQQLRSRKLIPKTPDEDQYILATMITMAQQHVYTSMDAGTGFEPKDIRVGVISMSREDASFVVYTAVISTALLAMFHYPDKAPPGDPKITVEYQRVPVWPVLGLKERLGQALGKDIVGEVDENIMETFEDESVSETDSDRLDKEINAVSLCSKVSGGRTSIPSMPQHTSRATLPKRKVLSEVFNTSFSEDRDSSDFPSELLAKRRCLEEGKGDEPEATYPERSSSDKTQED